MSDQYNVKVFENKDSKYPKYNRVPWDRLSKEEQDEIKEKAKIRREEEDRKTNKKIADIIMGKQKVIDTAWE